MPKYIYQLDVEPHKLSEDELANHRELAPAWSGQLRNRKVDGIPITTFLKRHLTKTVLHTFSVSSALAEILVTDAATPLSIILLCQRVCK